MTQEQIALSFPPASHRNDPVTSIIAEEKITASGKRQSQAMRVLEFVRRYPGRTSAELAVFHMTDVDWLVPARRLGDLQRNGLVRVAGKRLCAAKGTLCQTWEAI